MSRRWPVNTPLNPILLACVGLFGPAVLFGLLRLFLTTCAEEATTTCTKWCDSYHVYDGDVSYGRFECGTEPCQRCVARKWRWEGDAK